MTCQQELDLIRENDGLEGLGVDSGMLAVVDASASDRFLTACEPWYDGSMPPFGPDGHRTADGILLDAGGDGIYPCAAEACDRHAHTFWIELDEPTSEARWHPVGQVPVPSGLLLVGDPGMMEEYAPYPTRGPVDARGVWTTLAMPSGLVEVHVLRDPDAGYPPHLAIRLTEAR